MWSVAWVTEKMNVNILGEAVGHKFHQDTGKTSTGVRAGRHIEDGN